MRLLTGLLLSFFVIGLFSACSTLIYGTKNPIYISSTPEQLPIYINNKYVGETPMMLDQKFSISKKYVSVRMSEADDEKFNFIVEKKFRPVALLGLPLVVPYVTDLVTGASSAHHPFSVYYNFNNPEDLENWPFELETNGEKVKIDPMRVAENAKSKWGILKSNPETEENYEIKHGYSLTGVYSNTSAAFNLAFAKINAKDYSIIAANQVNSFTSFNNKYEGFKNILSEQSPIPIQFQKVRVDRIDRLEKSGKNEKKDNPKNTKQNQELMGELYQFWPVLTAKEGKQILFQAYPINQNAEFVYDLEDNLFTSINDLFVFVLWDGNQAVEISGTELMQNVDLFTDNPYLKKLCSQSKSELELQQTLNREVHHLSNILSYEWANKTGTPFFEVLPGKAKKTTGKDARKGDPGVVADNSTAREENKDNLNRYSGQVKGATASKDKADESYKYYGTEAPWYLQGQLKPEYRQSAKEMGLEEEEVYNPYKPAVDSTKWLKEQDFELIPPDVSGFKPGMDPGYINPEDPRKKPHEVNDTPWYLKKPKKESGEKKKEANPQGKM